MSHISMKSEIPEKMRLDKWLWCARFYKTRQLAATAVKTGNVKVNHNKAKPSRMISTGDNLIIDKKGLVFEVDVHALSQNRLSATLAAQLYCETESSIENRQRRHEIRRLDRLGAIQAPRGRPDKRGRRERVKVKRGE
jgi:ribosome-associated heat shock protein Hsp15